MPEKIDDDTLYFIYSSAANTTEGKLYLGQKLLSGVGGSSDIININDIGDVYIDDTVLSDKQILIYNARNNEWENASLSAIINTAVSTMTGATESNSGSSGLVPVPQAGDQNKFLAGDGTWKTISVPTFDTNVFNINNNEVSLKDYNLASAGSVLVKTNSGLQWSNSIVGSLNRQIVTLEKLQAMLDGTDEDPIDPNAIYMVRNSNSASSDNAYDEYMVINNKLEKLGVFGQVNLNDYVTTTVFDARVGLIEDVLNDKRDGVTGDIIPGLVSQVNYIKNNYISNVQIGDLNNLILSGDNTTLIEEVNSINGRLTWHTLEEEED